jgi:hypothetical protein
MYIYIIFTYSKSVCFVTILVFCHESVCGSIAGPMFVLLDMSELSCTSEARASGGDRFLLHVVHHFSGTVSLKYLYRRELYSEV